ncbi:MAG: histidine phosphatase family protein [Chloroflexi bacterium]|nr:histidine phosphatase family protein [Chloroflexota bacterium]
MEEQPLELLLVRHGESTANRDGTEEEDPELTELGLEQARRMAPWVAANFHLVAIYSSPLRRARHTAEILAQAVGTEVRFREDLREVDFELAMHMPRFSDPALAIGAEGRPLKQMSEEYIRFHDRIVQAAREIVNEHRSGTIAIVAHGGVISVLLRSIFGAHQTSVFADNTSLVLLRWMNDRWYMVFANRTEHLRSPSK